MAWGRQVFVATRNRDRHRRSLWRRGTSRDLWRRGCFRCRRRLRGRFVPAGGPRLPLRLPEAFPPIEQVVVLLELAQGHENEKGRRGHAHVDLIDDPGSIGFDFLVGGAENSKGFDKIVFVAGIQAHLENAQEAGFGKVDGLRAVAEVFAAYGDNRTLGGDEGPEFLLRAAKLWMRGVNPWPVRDGGVHLLEGIEGIEEKSFRGAGNRFQVDPVIGKVEMFAGA